LSDTVVLVSLPAPQDTTQAHPPHQARHRAAGDGDALPAELPPDLAHAIDAEVGRVHPPDLIAEGGIAPAPG
jgi:hypothetical protein